MHHDAQLTTVAEPVTLKSRLASLGVGDHLQPADADQGDSDSVIIDGCRVPGPLYRAVKLTARITQEMRYISVSKTAAGLVYNVFERRDDVTAGCFIVLWISPAY